MPEERRLLIITGPTAVGKTALSLRLAKALGGEIISADSMQVYRGMDIGTDKIPAGKMQGIPHHLIDILDPHESFNVFTFQRMAGEAAEEILQRGHLPIVVGGTGFYIQALLRGIEFSQDTDDGSCRRELEERAQTEGAEALYRELCSVDPETAAILHANNVKRVIRSLEFYRLTGEKISDHNRTQREREAVFDHLYFVLTDAREKLYERIDSRVDEMIRQGLEQEVRDLLNTGLTGAEPSMQGLGYRQMAQALRGEISFEEAVFNIKRDTRHFAKRQLTWFRREPEAEWIDRREYADDEAIFAYITERCSRKGWI